MFNVRLVIICFSFVFTGCSVTPEKMNESDVRAIVESDLNELQDYPSFQSPVSMEDAIARGLLHNREKRLKMSTTACPA